MKSLQQTLESILDADFDIHDEDINQLEEFLKTWKYGNKTKVVMPFGEFCKELGYVGTEVPGASVQDVTKALKAGNGFICVSDSTDSNNRRRTNWALYWAKSRTQYYMFDTVNQIAQWVRPSRGTAPNNLEWETTGLSGQTQVSPRYLPNQCRFFILPPNQYRKFFTIFGNNKVPE